MERPFRPLWRGKRGALSRVVPHILWFKTSVRGQGWLRGSPSPHQTTEERVPRRLLCRPRRWEAPAPEHVAVADGIVRRHLVEEAAALRAACEGAGGAAAPSPAAAKMQLHASLAKVGGWVGALVVR